jgi:hypothetical protein
MQNTSLLAIATILAGVGGGLLGSQFWYGIGSLLIAALLIIIRGILQSKGIDVGAKK